jgi:outer membrane protein TolC
MSVTQVTVQGNTLHYLCIKIDAMKKLSTGLLIFFFSASLSAQDTLTLALEDVLEVALKKNKEVIMAVLDQEIAAAEFKQTNALFLPQINVNYTALSTNNPLNAFGFKLQQQSIALTDFNPELLNSPTATQNFVTKAEWKQPLLNFDMLSKRKAAHHQVDVYAFKANRTKEYLTYEVKMAYAQLQLAHQAHQVLDEAAKTASTIHMMTASRFEKGFLQKSDVLNAQVQVATSENYLAEAKSNVQNASDYLSVLMGEQPGAIYRADPLQKIEANEIDTQIPDNRSDFLAMQSAVTAQDHMINAGRLSYLPKLNAFGEYMLNDKEAFGFHSDSYLVGAQLSWTLFNGLATRNRIDQQRIERNKMITQLNYQKEQSQVELNKTIRRMRDAYFELRQHEIAVEHAAEALRILRDRYQQGLVTTNDILQAHSLLSQQKLNQAQAVFNFNSTRDYLQFLTSTSEK